jgi:hypothetical protein
MPRRDDKAPSEIRPGLNIDKEKKFIIERHEDEPPTIHREYGGRWHSFPTRDKDATDDDP